MNNCHIKLKKSASSVCVISFFFFFFDKKIQISYKTSEALQAIS